MLSHKNATATEVNRGKGSKEKNWNKKIIYASSFFVTTF